MTSEFNPYHKWLGIPPDEQPPNHYRLLGVRAFEEDLDVIEAAADQRMAHLRTYQAGPRAALSQRLLNEVAAARVCLLDPAKKAVYDDAFQRQIPELDLTELEPEPERRAAAVPEPAPGPRPIPKPVLVPTSPRETAPVDRNLAGLFEQASVRKSTANRRVAAKRQQVKLVAILGPIAVGMLLLVGLLVWGTASDDGPDDRATAAKSRQGRAGNSSAKQTDSPRPSMVLTAEHVRALKPEEFAKVRVLSGGTFEPLKKGAVSQGDGKYPWEQIPDCLGNAKYLYVREPAQKGTTSFEILEAGALLLAVTTRWGGGGGLSPEARATLTTRDEFLRQGWRKVAQLGGSGRVYHWEVYYRNCCQGESFDLRTEKYCAPIIMLR